MNLIDLQTTVGGWFDTAHSPDTTREQHALKVCEEAGELARAVGCQSQGVRATREEWDTHLRLEAADVILATVALAHRCGFDLDAAVTERFAALRSRDNTGPRLP